MVVLPTVPFGVNTGQLDVKLDINMNPSTQLALLNDVAEVLSRHGIPKLVILNGHGGNDFKQMIRELAPLGIDCSSVRSTGTGASIWRGFSMTRAIMPGRWKPV